jgi:hypothetical protein
MKRNCRSNQQSGYSASGRSSFFFSQSRGSARHLFRVIRRSLEIAGTRVGISKAFFLALMFCSLCLITAAQTPLNGTPVSAPPSAPQATPSAPPPASGLLLPALDQVQQAVAALNVERWKKGSVRDEAGDHVSAILRDLHTTLPPLLNTADASPGTITKVLPLSRNLAALYDVLLSVNEAARISGSSAELNPLEQALTSLGTARTALDDRLQATAATLEKQEIDLRTTLQAREAVKCPVIPPPAKPVCPVPAPARKKKVAPKPPAATAQPSTPPVNSTPKPQN